MICIYAYSITINSYIAVRKKKTLTVNTRRRLTLVDLDFTIISGETILALTSVIINLIDACSYQVHGNEMIFLLSVNYIKLYTPNPQTWKPTGILTRGIGTQGGDRGGGGIRVDVDRTFLMGFSRCC